MRSTILKNIYKSICLVLVVAVFACDANVEVDKTFEEILAAQPTVVSFTPASAPIQSLVTITGTNLNFVMHAYIGGVEAEIYSRENQHTLIIKVPASATRWYYQTDNRF